MHRNDPDLHRNDPDLHLKCTEMTPFCTGIFWAFFGSLGGEKFCVKATTEAAKHKFFLRVLALALLAFVERFTFAGRGIIFKHEAARRLHEEDIYILYWGAPPFLMIQYSTEMGKSKWIRFGWTQIISTNGQGLTG